jgi:16S rRNA processing protein RimM
MASRDDELIEVGRVLGVHGVKGQVRVYSHTDPRENIVRYSPWLLERRGERRQLKVSGQRIGKHVVARLEGVGDRDQAGEWIGPVNWDQ